MKGIYKAFGVVGIIGYIIIIILIATSKSVDVSVKIGIIITSVIGMVGCAVYITVSNLMDKTEELDSELKMIKNYLSTTDGYLKFQKEIESAVLDDELKELEKRQADRNRNSD